MVEITLSEEILEKCPDLHVVALTCDVINTPSNEQLWEEIAREEEQFRKSYRIEDINKRIPIQATRQAYKKTGKDPNRYRPSAEALCRRILRGLPLYRIDSLVDVVNLVSIHSGFSIGAFDRTKIEGNRIILGIGKEGELYQGIGRGELNIAGLPVYRDSIGGIGTPTSDEERTKIDLSTRKLLMIINGYSGLENLPETALFASHLLKTYLSATQMEGELISGKERIQLVL